MPIRTDHDELILAAAEEREVLSPKQIAHIARTAGKEFYSSDYAYGWQTARRLVKAGKLVQIGPARFALAVHDGTMFGMPELGEVPIDALKRIKACFLLAATEMVKVEDKAHGTLQDWMHGAINRCNREAAFLDLMLEEGMCDEES